jgi:hypothetical protein
MDSGRNVSEIVETRSTWGTALGYFTGDPSLLTARGHSEEEILQIQKELRFRSAAGVIVSYAGTEGAQDIPDTPPKVDDFRANLPA